MSTMTTKPGQTPPSAPKPANTAAIPPPGAQPTAAKAVRGPEFRIERMERKERYLKFLIYGNYGVGKTTLACSAVQLPSMCDVLMINAEAGDLSVIDDTSARLDAVRVTSFKDLGRVYEYLRQHCIARDKGDIEFLKKSQAFVTGEEVESIGEPRQYRTVIIDSLTEVEAYSFNQLLGVTSSTRLDEEVTGAEWAEYKKNHGMILRLVRAFRDLPMHVMFVCAEQYSQDETKKFKYAPDLSGKLSKKVQGFMDMVGYLQVGKGENEKVIRRLYVTPSASGRYDAKHRYQQFKGEYFDNPTVGGILKEVGLLDPGGAKLR